MADVVIPRGAENTVAIDLVSQHLRYQLSKIHGSNIDMKKSNSSLIISNHEIIDPKYQFSEGKINVLEDLSQVELLREILIDFLTGKNIFYHKIFIENMLNSLIALYNQKNEYEHEKDFFLTEFDNFTKLESDVKKIVLYKHYILTESDCNDIKYVLNFNFSINRRIIGENKNCQLHILTTFLSPRYAEHLMNTYLSVKISFSTLYYSDYLLKYTKYIEKGGLIENVKEEEGYLLNEYTLFTKENFSENFKMHWKNYYVVSK
jgi:hypothetical protein